MAADFKMLTHLNGSYLHLKLEGKFDGVSARQLIGLLRRYSRKVSTVIIHTNALKRDDPLARDAFRNDLGWLREQPIRFIFTGEQASLFW